MSVDHLAATKRNIEQRKAAEVAHELAVTIQGEHGFEEKRSSLREGEVRVGAERYWEEVIRLAKTHLPSEIDVEYKPDKMTDQEARAFGQQETMPFGEFAGMRVDEVPLDRLLWYADQSFTDDLRRYLESNRIKNESNP